jgi:hypothetical protein
MATGHVAFPGNTSGVTFDGILNRAPVFASRLKPSLPTRLEEIIDRLGVRLRLEAVARKLALPAQDGPHNQIESKPARATAHPPCALANVSRRLRTGEKQPRRISLVARHFALSLARVEIQADGLERQNSRRRAADPYQVID